MKIVSIFLAVSFLCTFTAAQSEQKIQNEYIKINFDSASKFQSEKNINKSSSGLSTASDHSEIISGKINIPVKNADPFLAVSSTFYGSEIRSDNFIFSVRGSADGNIWDEWFRIDVNEHAEPNINEELGTLIFLKKEAKFIQYKIEINSNSVQLMGVRLVFISPGATSENTLEKIKEIEPEINFVPDLSTYNANKTSGTYPRPPIVTRTEWGCPQWQGGLSNPTLTTPTHLIVHHSAGANSSNDWPAIVRSYYTLHTQTNGWSDIGYNWLIDAHGIIYQGRAWYQNSNDNVLGAHFCGTNTGTMGVCVMGTYTSVNATEAARRSLVKILSYKASERNIDPHGVSYHPSSGLTLNHISGHRDGVCSTECPGTTLWNHLPIIRDRVYAFLNPPEAVTFQADSVDENSAKLMGEINPLNSVTSVYFQWGKDSLTNTFNITSAANGDSLISYSELLDSLDSFTTYQYRIAASNSDTISYGNIEWFNTTEQIPGIPQLNFPENNAQNIPTEVLFDWSYSIGAVNYWLQVSEDSLFAHLIIDEQVADTSFLSTELNNLTKYWWKVSAKNQNGESDFTDVRTFTTILNLPQQVQLYSPLDSAAFISDSVSLIWQSSSPQVNYYWVELSTEPNFVSPIIDSTLSDTSKIFMQFEDGQYWWRVRANNLSGWGEFSTVRYFEISTATSVDDFTNLPQNYKLFQNYPNPFNPSTRIKFALPEKSQVKLKIFDLLGREISILKEGNLEAGYYEFVWNAAGYPSGIYFYKFEYQTENNKNNSLTRKLILLK